MNQVLIDGPENLDNVELMFEILDRLLTPLGECRLLTLGCRGFAQLVFEYAHQRNYLYSRAHIVAGDAGLYRALIEQQAVAQATHVVVFAHELYDQHHDLIHTARDQRRAYQFFLVDRPNQEDHHERDL